MPEEAVGLVGCEVGVLKLDVVLKERLRERGCRVRGRGGLKVGSLGVKVGERSWIRRSCGMEAD